MMKPPRRRFLRLAATAALLPAGSRIARAQAYPYPVKPVHFLVGFPAGGPNDILARVVGGSLSERLGQPFVIENRPGASGNIATEAVVRAAPDGYTLLLVGPANAINASFDKTLKFNFMHDIVPVAAIAREPLVMLVHPSLPVKTVAEFIAYAQAHPGKITMASAGKGSAPHVTGELFKMMSGADLAVVHYAGGGPALKEMIAGRAEVMFEPISAAIKPVRAGTLRALAVTTAVRSEALPGIPALGESVPGFEASAVTGVGVPRNTPAEIVAMLNKAINASLADPKMKARLGEMGSTVLPGSAADFGKLLAEETEKWAKVVGKLSSARPG